MNNKLTAYGLILVDVFGLLAVSPTLAQQPPKYDEQKLPYRAQWGPYTIQVVKQGKDGFDPDRLRILDAQGRILKEFRGMRITGLAYPKLDPHGPPALQVSAFSGGAHCCTTDYFFTRGRGLRNILVFNGGNGEVTGIKDLNGDGRPEIIASNDALAYFGGLPYAFTPQLEMVIGWDGHGYADQTRRYPQRALAGARELRAALTKVLHSTEEAAEDERRGSTAGYYASMVLAGQGEEARVWLKEALPASTLAWFKANEADLQQVVRPKTAALGVDQHRVLKLPE